MQCPVSKGGLGKRLLRLGRTSGILHPQRLAKGLAARFQGAARD